MTSSNALLTSDDLGLPRKGHSVSVNHGCNLPIPIHVHITIKHTDVRKFQALKRYGTQISLDMIPEIRSQVKGHSRYGLQNFEGRCKIVQWLGMLSFVTIGRSVRELFSENPRGVASPPPLCRRGLRLTQQCLGY